MTRILRIPKIQLVITLLLIFLTSLLYAQSLRPLIVLIATLFATIGSDLIFAKIRKLPLLLPSAAIASGLIISLVTSPALSFIEPISIGVIAMLFKNFVRISGRHILNPAAIGLLIGAFAFQHNISWWGTSWQQFSIPFLILLSPAIVSVFRMRRHKIIFSFLIVYYLSNLIFNSSFLNLNSFLDPTVIFFSLVMLPEPMTSPSRSIKQVMFGIFTAVFSITLSLPVIYSLFPILEYNDSLIASLLIGNVIFFKFRTMQFLTKRKDPPKLTFRLGSFDLRLKERFMAGKRGVRKLIN